MQGHGVEARASSRARYADRAGRRVREWQGLTLIAQRPQRRGEQHRAWASIVGIAVAGPPCRLQIAPDKPPDRFSYGQHTPRQPVPDPFQNTETE